MDPRFYVFDEEEQCWGLRDPEYIGEDDAVLITENGLPIGDVLIEIPGHELNWWRGQSGEFDVDTEVDSQLKKIIEDKMSLGEKE